MNVEQKSFIYSVINLKAALNCGFPKLPPPLCCVLPGAMITAVDTSTISVNDVDVL